MRKPVSFQRYAAIGAVAVWGGAFLGCVLNLSRMQEPYLEPLLRWMRLRRVMHHIPNDYILLDVGCGRAPVFIKAISPYIRQVIGVDFKVENTRLIIKILYSQKAK